MFCPSCGHANRDGDRFCAVCGRSLQASPVQQRVSTAPVNQSLDASINRLGIKTGPGMLKVIVVASLVGLILQYGILPFVGVGALTGGDPGINALILGGLSFLVSFGVAYRMRGGGHSRERLR